MTCYNAFLGVVVLRDLGMLDAPKHLSQTSAQHENDLGSTYFGAECCPLCIAAPYLSFRGRLEGLLFHKDSKQDIQTILGYFISRNLYETH